MGWRVPSRGWGMNHWWGWLEKSMRTKFICKINIRNTNTLACSCSALRYVLSASHALSIPVVLEVVPEEVGSWQLGAGHERLAEMVGQPENKQAL